MDYLQKVLAMTEKNAARKSTKISVNERIVEVLKEDVRMTRIQLVTAITKLRVTEMKTSTEIEKLAKSDELLKYVEKTRVTIKNGVDTSIAKGQTNSNFCIKYADSGMTLECESNEYYIVRS